MSIQQARIEGGKAFRAQWGPSLLVLLLELAAVIVATTAVFGVGGLIISGPAAVGVYYCYYQALQGEKIVYKDMLYGIKTNFGEIVLGYLIKAAFIFGIAIAAYALMFTFGLAFIFAPIVSIILIVLISIAAIVAIIIFALHLAAVEYILMREPDIKGWDAVKKSKRIMSGNTGRYFGFVLSFIGWFILTAIFFPLAIFTAPYFMMSKTVFIGSIYDEAERRAQEPVYTAPQAPVYAAPQAPVQEAPQAAPAPAAPQAAPAQEAPKAAVKYCKHCGSPLPMEAMFCSKCGGAQDPIVNKAAEIKADAVEKAEEVKEAVEEKVEAAAEKIEEVKETVAEKAEEVKEAAEEKIEEIKEAVEE